MHGPGRVAQAACTKADALQMVRKCGKMKPERCMAQAALRKQHARRWMRCRWCASAAR
jgi:hypothetical protein